MSATTAKRVGVWKTQAVRAGAFISRAVSVPWSSLDDYTSLITEGGDNLTTEGGDILVLEGA